MSDSVTITTGARLHFGLLVEGEPDRRIYGGIGMMVDEPRYVLHIRRADRDEIAASPDVVRRIQDIISRLREAGIEGTTRIEVREEIPAHAGLGSGTQLALAAATGLFRLHGSAMPEIEELVRLTGRGKRTAIGTVGFSTGGVIFDQGHAPPLQTTASVHWRFLLVTPPSQHGLSGVPESQAFHELPPLDAERADIVRKRLLDLWAAMIGRNFSWASFSLWEVTQLIGAYFAPIQGCVFANPRMAALAERLRADGIRGVGQSSWGPTLFAFCEDQASAESAAEMVRESVEWGDCAVRIVKALNRGALIESH